MYIIVNGPMESVKRRIKIYTFTSKPFYNQCDGHHMLAINYMQLTGHWIRRLYPIFQSMLDVATTPRKYQRREPPMEVAP